MYGHDINFDRRKIVLFIIFSFYDSSLASFLDFEHRLTRYLINRIIIIGLWLFRRLLSIFFFLILFFVI